MSFMDYRNIFFIDKTDVWTIFSILTPCCSISDMTIKFFSVFIQSKKIKKGFPNSKKLRNYRRSNHERNLHNRTIQKWRANRSAQSND